MIDKDEAWAAVMRRDRSFDGRFVTGVLTTGIYCRPSCAARHPARENVRFFPDGEAARITGLRACKRCLPDDVARDEAALDRALAMVRVADGPVPLAELAAATGYSPTHFQRVFTRAVGMSPAAYYRALRREKAGDALRDNDRVTDAIYDAGYGAASRFYEDAKGRMGMTPSAWANGGKGVTIHWAVVGTTMGPMLVAATDKGVCRLSFDEGIEALETRFPNAELVKGGTEFSALLEQVVAGVEEPGKGFAHIPLDVKGTAFQEACWAALRAIPAGETRTYAEIAAAAGNPKAVRAAGSANARNNVAVLIPCHRVIRTGGDLGGYAYGLDIKRELLRREMK